MMKNNKILSEEFYYEDGNRKVKRTYIELFTIYRILFEDNTFYIGSTTDFESRKNQHINGWDIEIKSIKKLITNEVNNKLEARLLKRYINKFGLDNCRNKDLNPYIIYNKIKTIDAYCSDLVTSIQKQCQAFNYKRTTIGVEWKDAASRFGVSDRAIKKINTLYNELNELGYEDDFYKMFDNFEGGKVCHPSQFEWLKKRCSSFSNALNQLREFKNIRKAMEIEPNLDLTETDPKTGETIKKEKNFFMQEDRRTKEELIEEVGKLKREIEELKTKLDLNQ